MQTGASCSPQLTDARPLLVARWAPRHWSVAQDVRPASTWTEAQLLARSRLKAPETVWGYFISAGGVACAYSDGSLRAPGSLKTLDKAGNPSEMLSRPHHQELRRSVCRAPDFPSACALLFTKTQSARRPLEARCPARHPVSVPPWAQPPTWHDSAEGPTSGHRAPSPERHPPAASSVHPGRRQETSPREGPTGLADNFLSRALSLPFKTFLFCEMGSA